MNPVGMHPVAGEQPPPITPGDRGTLVAQGAAARAAHHEVPIAPVRVEGGEAPDQEVYALFVHQAADGAEKESIKRRIAELELARERLKKMIEKRAE